MEKDLTIPFDDYPLAGTSRSTGMPRDISTTEISFSGVRQNYCVFFVDMVDSTKTEAGLSKEKTSKYYSIFLNSIATIALNFEAEIVKNVGDSLIVYFPNTNDPSNTLAFVNVIECGLTMIEVHGHINSLAHSGNLPSINYRISADYGQVEIAAARGSTRKDLFGRLMNMCAKINSKAPSNSMIIGHDLHEIVRTFPYYSLEKCGEYSLNANQSYATYLVKTKA